MYLTYVLEAIQVLRNADGGGGMSNFPEKSVTREGGRQAVKDAVK